MEQAVEKKITPTDAIIMMINAINGGKEGDFYSIAEQFARGLASSGGNRYRILNIIRQKPTRLKALDEMPPNIKKLLIQAGKEVGNVFLTDETRAVIDTLLSEWENRSVYDLHKIPVRNKLLLHGPTGNGKTTIARYIASKSNLPFIEINSDSVIDSHLGSTSTNIHNILNSIQEPCILFWDEIDSIGIKRGVAQDSASHENDRMTNSFLINMERLGDKVILIGATNRMEVLDAAFLRRFDLKIEIPAPEMQEKVDFVDQLCQYHNLPLPEEAGDLTTYSSYSEIKNRFMEIGRRHLLSLHQNDA
jgi:SpoVK/Ycf46/Vps4 family AAA+-type ATPase